MPELMKLNQRCAVIMFCGILFFALATGCKNGKSNSTSTPTPITPTLILTVMPTLTATGYETATTTPIPTEFLKIYKPRLTMTAIYSQIPLTPLTPGEVQARVEELMQDNGNCSEPCFWGIVPGKTDFIKSARILFPLDNPDLPIYDEQGNTYFTIYVNYADKIHLGITLLEKNFVTDNLDVQMNSTGGMLNNDDYKSFSLVNILKTYGVPTSIEFSLSFPTEPTSIGWSGYNYSLFYDDQMMKIDHHGQTILSSNSPSCLSFN